MVSRSRASAIRPPREHPQHAGGDRAPTTVLVMSAVRLDRDEPIVPAVSWPSGRSSAYPANVGTAPRLTALWESLAQPRDRRAGGCAAAGMYEGRRHREPLRGPTGAAPLLRHVDGALRSLAVTCHGCRSTERCHGKNPFHDEPRHITQLLGARSRTTTTHRGPTTCERSSPWCVSFRRGRW